MKFGIPVEHYNIWLKPKFEVSVITSHRVMRSQNFGSEASFSLICFCKVVDTSCYLIFLQNFCAIEQEMQSTSLKYLKDDITKMYSYLEIKTH